MNTEEEELRTEDPSGSALGRIMDRPLLERQQILVGMNVGYALVVIVLLEALQQTALRSYLDGEVVSQCQILNAIGGIVWLGIVLACGHLRRRGRTRPFLLGFFVHTWAVHNAIMLYLVGMFHTPLWLLLAAGLYMALILIDRKTVRAATATGMVTIGAMSVLQASRTIPYAPIFVRPPFEEDGSPQIAWAGAMLFAIAVLMLGIWLIGDRLITRWREREATFRELSTQDPLTLLSNRRHFMHRLEGECARASRLRMPLSLVMCDADLFKRVNDERGHAVGDRVLRALADILRASIRQAADLPARIGGEELAIILPHTGPDEARRVAERIRAAAEAFEHRDDAGRSFRVTLSLGIASWTGHDQDGPAEPSILLREADQCLYGAKKEGRNRVVGAEKALSAPAGKVKDT